jgi:hypothetical protein
MILDSQLKFSAAQAVTADALSTNYIDLGGSGNNVFDGEPMAVLLHITTAADGTTTDETYEFKIQTDDNTSFSSATDLAAVTIGYASLTANSLHVIPIPVGKTVERYLTVYYNVGGTTPSVTLSAYLVPLYNVQKYRVYADGLTIS